MSNDKLGDVFDYKLLLNFFLAENLSLKLLLIFITKTNSMFNWI